MSRSQSLGYNVLELTEVTQKYDNLLDTFCDISLDTTSVLNNICLSDLCQDSNFLSSLQINTDNVTECSNLYYTDTRVCAFIAGGTLGDITTTGTINGPATFTIDPAAVGDNTGTVIIAGNLQVDGTTTTINSTNLTIEDKNIVLASGSTSGSISDGSGITVCLGTNGEATLTYSNTADSWQMNKSLITNLTGQVSDISNHYTCDLTECGNLYYTDARADARVACGLSTFQLDQLSDVDASGNALNTVLTSDGCGSYIFQAPSSTTSLCNLTDNIDFTDSCTSGYVLTSDGDGTFSFQETDTFGAIIYSLALG